MRWTFLVAERAQRHFGGVARHPPANTMSFARSDVGKLTLDFVEVSRRLVASIVLAHVLSSDHISRVAR
jgi:hypothetical protein